MPARIAILADDLSGAADCAVACHRAGFSARVCLETPDSECDAEALALDLDSRAGPAGAARARTLAAAPRVQGRVLYRKIDSTLRGHVAVEMAATLGLAGPGAFAVVCPAYPATGRAVADGRIRVHGKPLEQTEIWRRDGRGSPRLGELLAEAGLDPAFAGLDEVRGGLLGDRLRRARAAGARAVLCDAETEDDLERIVAAALPLPDVVWAGSGGLTIPLARALAGGRAGAPARLARRPGPVLAAVGSASSTSHGQFERLALDPRVQSLSIPAQVLLDGPEGPGWRATGRAVVAAVGRPGKDVAAVRIDPGVAADPAQGPALTAALGSLLGRQLGRFAALAATGGETARRLLAEGGFRALDVRGEIEPGVVLSDAGGLPVVTKAGAFGGPDSLVQAVDALRALPLA